MLQDSSFWVLVAFVIFFGFLFYLKVPGQLSRSLDERAEKIKRELEEAEKLHREAQHLFAEYQRKQRNAMKEAEDIVAAAQAEAKRIAEAAKADLTASLERRRLQAEQKIAQAEQTALREVRDAAVDMAVNAASTILREKLQGPAAAAQTERAIADVKAKLH
ncbi:F0F1 ATP synthase subunit B [Ferrovibrio sp.]|uniref:F0F1 ATP synthase subunit B family protein n=1 Tax=Ferrovibrio sp. TaxID=1917215 RepID=UPI001B7BA4F3|nr:F0F1 ATP synthase subunit B [Ferrovibrio sp.]MBP7063948.1 F0F1 ATP synthase subunit B [Ferrovibrio sp.]